MGIGGVGTRPWRMRKSEQVLIGKAPSRLAFKLAADLAREGIRRLPGNRYKADLMPHTIVRALEMAGDVR